MLDKVRDWMTEVCVVPTLQNNIYVVTNDDIGNDEHDHCIVVSFSSLQHIKYYHTSYNIGLDLSLQNRN